MQSAILESSDPAGHRTDGSLLVVVVASPREAEFRFGGGNESQTVGLLPVTGRRTSLRFWLRRRPLWIVWHPHFLDFPCSLQGFGTRRSP